MKFSLDIQNIESMHKIDLNNTFFLNKMFCLEFYCLTFLMGQNYYMNQEILVLDKFGLENG